MGIKTDRYTKVILTVIAVLLLALLFKPDVQRALTPTPANAISKLEGVMDSTGSPVLLMDVYVRNTDGVPVPMKTIGKVEVSWEKPMPVYIVEKKD